jgi:hypothetical protein
MRAHPVARLWRPRRSQPLRACPGQPPHASAQHRHPGLPPYPPRHPPRRPHHPLPHRNRRQCPRPLPRSQLTCLPVSRQAHRSQPQPGRRHHHREVSRSRRPQLQPGPRTPRRRLSPLRGAYSLTLSLPFAEDMPSRRRTRSPAGSTVSRAEEIGQITCAPRV